MGTRKQSVQVVLDQAKKMDGPFSPTELGKAMGYEHREASTRVAKALKELTVEGVLNRTQHGGNRVTYAVV